RDVLDQGAPRRGWRCDRRHLPRARPAPRPRLGSVGLGHGVRPGAEARRAAARADGAEVMSRILFLALLAGLGLAACGEREQVVVYKQGKYQGKPDGRPWDSDSPVAELRGGKWSKGDRNSWEEQIKQRQMEQHEHKRIYQQ